MIWVPVKTSTTVYNGSLVGWDTSAAADEGVLPLPAAAGVGNATNYDVPFGVVIGNNEKNPIYSTTYLAEGTTQGGTADPHGGPAREYVGLEGPWSKNEGTSFVKIAVITPSTILRAPIRLGAIGTNITELTATSGSASGVTATTNACGFTPVASMCTIYCRKGANAGVYRITSDTSTTVAAWDVAMPADTAAGDVFVRVPIKIGHSYMQLGDSAVCSFIDGSATPASNYWQVMVTRLDLREKGKEFAEFYFIGTSFMPQLVSQATT